MRYKLSSLTVLFLICLAAAASGQQDSIKIDQDSSSNSTKRNNIELTKSNYPDPF